MTTLDQTFKAYYASMADSDLLKLAANKNSYIDVAQRMMTEELVRRHLSLPAIRSAPGRPRFRWSTRSAIAKLTTVFRH